MADNKSKFDFFLWWKIDPDKLNKQVEQYGSLKIYRSARGISLLWFIFSAVSTAIMILAHAVTVNAIADISVFLILGIFIYQGHRWAMIGAMIFWTFEKLQASVTAPVSFIFQLIWWMLYMHYFYLAYKVEQKRIFDTK